MTGRLVERDDLLAALARLYAEAATDGRLALVSGEAGAGKTALVEAFLASRPDARVLAGRCDDLFAARSFGALADMVPAQRHLRR